MNPRPGARSPTSVAGLVAHAPDELQRGCIEVLDVVADDDLPAFVRGIAVEQAKRGLEVVALDEVEEVARRSARWSSRGSRRDGAPRPGRRGCGRAPRRTRLPCRGAGVTAVRRSGSCRHRRVLPQESLRLQVAPQARRDRLVRELGVLLDLLRGARADAHADDSWMGMGERDHGSRQTLCGPVGRKEIPGSGGAFGPLQIVTARGRARDAARGVSRRGRLRRFSAGARARACGRRNQGVIERRPDG